MRLVSLCSGYGGLDLAVEAVFDATTVAYAELEPAPAAVFARHWPDAFNIGDIANADWNQVRRDLMSDRKRPSDARAEAMYDRYRRGLSLAQVAAEFGVTRQSVYGLFKTRGWDLRPRPEALESVEFEGRRYAMRNTGYYGCTTGDRGLLHRHVWEHHYGPIPDDYDIHHRDHDKTNNDIDNLECLPRDEHARLYGTGCNQHTHGCGGGDANEEPAVDIVAAGFP